MSNKTKTTKPTIIMVAFNHISRRFETVQPEDEAGIFDLTPMFWSGVQGKYVTVPGMVAEDVYGEWLAE